MAAPAYTTDLTSGVISNGEEATGYSEPTGATAGAITMNDADFFIQGTACCSKTQAVTGYAGIIYNAGAVKTIPSPGALFVWMFYAATSTLASEAAGGFRIIAGSATSAFRHWYVRGVDTYAYGGWICVPVDPTVAGDGTDTGTPNMSALQYFGTIAYVPGPGYAQRGNPHGLDAMRFGRGESRIANGSTADGYATFLGYSATNDNQSNRWGLIQAVAPGVHSAGYLVQGLVIFGYGAATDFRDSNTSIVISDTKKVVSSFNAFEVRNATSRVDLTAISFTALGTTSRGNWITTDNADVNIDGCTFTDMGTFGFLSGATILNTTFRRCSLVTQGGATITSCRFDAATGAVALLASNPATITGSTFVSDGTGHAIEITTPGTYALSDLTFSGYAATGTPGTSGNEVIYNNSGGAVTINASGCAGTITYKNGAGASTTVNQTITLTLTGLQDGSDITVLAAGTTTERINVQGNSGTTYAYGYADSGTSVDIGVFKAGYVPIYIRGYSLSASASSLPIKQVVDRAYLE